MRACWLRQLCQVLAHGSFAAGFEQNKTVALKGSVTKLERANPHIWVYADVKEDQAGAEDPANAFYQAMEEHADIHSPA